MLLYLVWCWHFLATGVAAVSCKYKQDDTVIGIQLSAPAQLKCEDTLHGLHFDDGSGDLEMEHAGLQRFVSLQDARHADTGKRDLYQTLDRLGDFTKLMKLMGKRSKKRGSTLENEVVIESGLSEIEDEALEAAYAELTALKRKLNSTVAKLDLREAQMANLNDTLRKSQSQLTTVSARLLKAESRLAKTALQKERLERRLTSSDERLGQISEELLELQDIYLETHTRLTEGRTMINFLQGRVGYFSAQLNHTDIRLRDTTLKYNKLTRHHERALHIITFREEQLTECLKSKTNQFCGFEHETICGYTFDTENSKFNWTRGQGPTPSLRTGPDIDHTCRADTGHYMHIESSARRFGDNARMVSPRFQSVDKSQCVEFYYHMNGEHCGTLSVHILVKGVHTTPLWRMVGNQGDVWTLARVAVPRQLAMRGYKIAFEGVVEMGFRGDIAIDDVKIYDGRCPTDNGEIINMREYRRRNRKTG